MMTEQYNLSNFHNRYININNQSELLNKTGYNYLEFESNIYAVKFYALLIIQNIPNYVPEQVLLKQQISELLSNAIIHGNNNESQKKIHIWFNYITDIFSLIIQDEGNGFHNIEEWNEWCKQRREYINTNKLYQHPQYLTYNKNKLYHTHLESSYLNGTALFAAVEYWNCGVVYTEKGNTVAVRKDFHIEAENELS
jgi:hypothetical protein